ncbi:hypothetical protein OAP35_02255 [Planktomarina temperata]|nr:hypothetical protein [Planktomarina temperata]
MKLLSYMMRGLVAVLIAAGCGSANAEERLYGSFIYNSDIPNALFFMDEIKNGDDFELRKALRNHDIDTIVLASPGGSVWAGLSMAGIIFDKKLRVYVPPKGVCASACSFMFFGGNERLSEGELGVHQFASSDSSKTANAVKTQAQSQFTVSEIIGFLNEFDTPRFVLERMFEDREMYWFDEDEIGRLNSEEFTLDSKILTAVSTYASKKLKEAEAEKTAKPKYSEKELIALIQKRLNEIGCSAGVADGIWGRRTNAAAVQFAKKAGLSTSTGDLISEEFFDALANAKKGFCPKPRPSTPQTFAAVYEYNCNGGPTANELIYFVRHDKSNKVAYLRISNGETDAIKYSGKSFKTNKGHSGRLFFNSKGYVYKFTLANSHCSNLIFQPKK